MRYVSGLPHRQRSPRGKNPGALRVSSSAGNLPLPGTLTTPSRRQVGEETQLGHMKHGVGKETECEVRS